MKILVISDSHGDNDSIEQAYARERPDEIIFLGDGLRDIEMFGYTFPGAKISSVRGNCDFFSRSADEFTLSYGGLTVFVCHGHAYGVKNGVSLLAYTAKKKGASIALFGHTHEPYLGECDGVTLLNPGSIRNERYGIITVTGNTFECALRSL